MLSGRARRPPRRLRYGTSSAGKDRLQFLLPRKLAWGQGTDVLSTSNPPRSWPAAGRGPSAISDRRRARFLLPGKRIERWRARGRSKSPAPRRGGTNGRDARPGSHRRSRRPPTECLERKTGGRRRAPKPRTSEPRLARWRDTKIAARERWS